MTSTHAHDQRCGGASPAPAVFECLECGTRFEDGVADPDAAGIPRCPQCGFAHATRLTQADGNGFIVRASTKFR